MLRCLNKRRKKFKRTQAVSPVLVCWEGYLEASQLRFKLWANKTALNITGFPTHEIWLVCYRKKFYKVLVCQPLEIKEGGDKVARHCAKRMRDELVLMSNLVKAKPQFKRYLIHPWEDGYWAGIAQSIAASQK